MSAAYNVTPTIGLTPGATIQFAEGRWPGEIGEGVAITEEGFDLVEPSLRAAAPDWTPEHRYGVFELSGEARRSLASRLRVSAAGLRNSAGLGRQIRLLDTLAAWLEERLDERCPVSTFGL